jgi:hypothetical protein
VHADHSGFWHGSVQLNPASTNQVTLFRQPTTHGIGSGMLSPDCTKFVLSIPKNASSYLVDWSAKNGWSSAVVDDNCDWHKVQEVIVFLRDPVQRWISGVAQYLNGHVLNVSNAYTSEDGPDSDDQYMSADQFISEYNTVIERILFDQLTELDDHVWPQTRFLDVLQSIPRTHFMINSGFTQTVSQHLKFTQQDNLDHNRGISYIERCHVHTQLDLAKSR